MNRRMKAFYYGIMIASTIILLSISGVSCIKCFQCNSSNNSACMDLEMIGRNPLYPTECEGDFGGVEPFCRKITLELLDGKRKHEARVVRGCGWIPYKNPCYNADNEDHIERVCQCFEDGCNGAQSSEFIYAFLALPLFTHLLN